MASSMLICLMSLSALLAVGLTDKIPFTDCGSKEGSINSIDISGCVTPPCKFKKGTKVSVEIDFTANKDIIEANSKVHGIIFGLPAPFPLPDSNSCHYMQCPVSAGSSMKYKHAIYVEPMYPSINVKVQWKLLSPSGNIVCFQVPARVES